MIFLVDIDLANNVVDFLGVLLVEKLKILLFFEDGDVLQIVEKAVKDERFAID